jgi:hypothetical protein
MTDIYYLHWIGYVASAIIALSMTMSSIVKFRIINLFGAILFSTYGFIISAVPVGMLNTLIACIDIYYLYSIFIRRDDFEILEVRNDNLYLLRFLEFHKEDIQTFFPEFTYKPELNTISFFVLRNMAVAGLFLAHERNNGEIRVGLDYVIPEYRDFKNGRFVYILLSERFVDKGITRVTATKTSSKHMKYLKKLGFVENEAGLLEKKLNP